MRIAIYCQNVLGVGHLIRSLNIARELEKSFEVLVISGGKDISSIHSTNHNIINLEPIWFDKDFTQLQCEEEKTVSSCFSERKKVLETIAQKKIDCLITEMFPLGRPDFFEEIEEFINSCKKENPLLKVYGSVRDIVLATPGPRNIKIINNFYEKIFIHSDPNILKLDHRFKEINKKFVYTGYVTPSFSASKRIDNLISVSIGGGAFGYELLFSVLKIAHEFPNFIFEIFGGPNLPSDQREKLLQDSQGIKNVEIFHSIKNLEEQMIRSRLSISMGGYNTSMGLLVSKTFGIIYPYEQNSEQLTRAIEFKKYGLAEIVTKDQLNSAELIQIINLSLDNKTPQHIDIDINGAKFTADYIKRELYE